MIAQTAEMGIDGITPLPIMVIDTEYGRPYIQRSPAALGEVAEPTPLGVATMGTAEYRHAVGVDAHESARRLGVFAAVEARGGSGTSFGYPDAEDLGRSPVPQDQTPFGD